MINPQCFKICRNMLIFYAKKVPGVIASTFLWLNIHFFTLKCFYDLQFMENGGFY